MAANVNRTEAPTRAYARRDIQVKHATHTFKQRQRLIHQTAIHPEAIHLVIQL